MKLHHGIIAFILILALSIPVSAATTYYFSDGKTCTIPDKFEQLSDNSRGNRRFLDKSSNILLVVHSHCNMEKKQYEYYVENKKRRQTFNENFINSFITDRRKNYSSYKLVNYQNFDFNGLYGMKIKGEIKDSDKNWTETNHSFSDNQADSWINSDYVFFNNKTIYCLTLYCPGDIYYKHENMLDDMAKSITMKNID